MTMIELYHASGAGDFTISHDALTRDQCHTIFENAANFQADDIFSPADKDRMEREITAGLRNKLMLEEVIKDYSYCLRRHFQHLVDDDYPVRFGVEARDIQLEKRQIIYEVLRQVEFLDRELEDFRCGLGKLPTT